MEKATAKARNLAAPIALTLIIALLLGGLAWHGLSIRVLRRVWGNLLDRPGGPMTFRFVLQPAMAVLAAAHDGISDARTGRPPFLAGLMRNKTAIRNGFQEALNSTARIILLGIIMDVIYQMLVLNTFYPAEAALIALALCFLPYALARGPARRLAKRWLVDPT